MAGSLKDLVWQKEKEWRDLVDGRIVDLERQNLNKSNELVKLTEVFERLKADFKYNLHLLKQRDAELAEYEQQTALYRQQLASKTDDCSRLAMAVDDLRGEVETEQATKLEIQHELQRCLNDRQTDMEALRQNKDEELVALREEQTGSRRKAKLEIVRLTSELDRQKQELLGDVRSTLRQKDDEILHKSEELNTRAQSSELKSNLLEKELEAVKASRHRIEEELNKKDAKVCSLELAVQEMESKYTSELSIRCSEIEQLHQQLVEQKQKSDSERDEFCRKIKQVDIVIKDREHSLQKLNESIKEDRSQYEAKLQSLREALESVSKERQNQEWTHSEGLKEKVWEMERLKSDIVSLQGKSESLQQDVISVTLQRDQGVRDAQAGENNLREELRKRIEENTRLHQDLERALEKEAAIEQDRLQSDLQWQRKTEEVELSQVNRMESLIKQLSNSAEQSRARVSVVEKTLEEKEILIRSLLHDRKHVSNMSSLQLPPNPRANGSHSVTEEELRLKITSLEEQNSNLKHVISQMTEEMAQHASKNTTEASSVQQKVEFETAILSSGDEIIKKNKYITGVVNSSNQLRQERIELIAQCRRQQTRIQNLESRIEELQKEIREHEMNLEKMSYEIGANQRQRLSEVDGLRKRISELEMQLSESYTELSEYCKGNIELTRLNEELQNEVSIARTLHVKKTLPTPHVNFGAQEMMIQHLQDEVQRLRDQFTEQTLTSADEYPKTENTGEPGVVAQMREKLKQAANQIQKLATEKQVLIELSNRLRAELKSSGTGIKPSVTPNALPRHASYPRSAIADKGDCSVKPAEDYSRTAGNRAGNLAHTMHDVENKLVELEKLQYEISRQKITEDAASVPSTKRNTSKNHEERRHHVLNDSVSTSIAADNIQDVFTLLNEPPSLSDSVPSVDHIQSTRKPTLDSRSKPINTGVPPLQIRGESAPSVSRDRRVDNQRNIAMDRLVFTKRK